MDVMLKLNRITLENTEKTHRMEDVSFPFPIPALSASTEMTNR